MAGVLVQVSFGGPEIRRTWRLGAGAQLSFGRDLFRFSAADLPDVVGQISVGQWQWSVENSSQAAVVAENLEEGHDFVKIAPGRSVAVPFGRARVLVLWANGLASLTVHTQLHQVYQGGALGENRHPDGLLDEQAKYFRVLVALCEPALRYGSVTAIPTSAQIARRLRGLRAYRHMTVNHVQFHLNYLLTNKLHAHLDAYSSIQGSPMNGTYSRRAALIDLALRFSLVARRHLELLEPGSDRGLRHTA